MCGYMLPFSWVAEAMRDVAHAIDDAIAIAMLVPINVDDSSQPADLMINADTTGNTAKIEAGIRIGQGAAPTLFRRTVNEFGARHKMAKGNDRGIVMATDTALVQL